MHVVSKNTGRASVHRMTALYADGCHGDILSESTRYPVSETVLRGGRMVRT